MTTELHTAWERMQAPDFGHLVFASCHSQFPIRKKCYILHGRCIATQNTDCLSCGNMPEPGCFVDTACEQKAAIRRKLDAIHPFLMIEFAHQLPCGSFPKPSGLGITCGNILAIR